MRRHLGLPRLPSVAGVILVAVLGSVAFVETQLRGGSSLRVPMSPEEFRALGEMKHAEYYDGMCVVNPPSRRHVVAVRRLARRLSRRLHRLSGLGLAHWATCV